MKAPKKNIPNLRGPALCKTDPTDGPTPGVARIPDANVADTEEHCLVPPHAESTRLNTGAPCEDGRNAK